MNESWFRDSNLSWTQRLALKILRTGQVPRHVAFIMDGNRRFANKQHLSSAIDGHVHGFSKLAETLQWCRDIGIEEVTVYAFSIENFKRPSTEVDGLMRLSREKFAKFMEEKDELDKRGVCVRMIGNWSLLPIDLQQKIAEVVLMTRNNSKAILNVAFAYTSRDEITHSIKAIVDGVRQNELEPCDISESLIRRCMYTGESSDPDLLVRTSGEIRLSDFLLWQTSASIIYFTQTLWPEFTFWHLLAGVFMYQRHCSQMRDIRNDLEKFNITDQIRNELPECKDVFDDRISAPATPLDHPRIQTFLKKFTQRNYERLIELGKIEMNKL